MTITKNGATLTIQANTGTSLADSGTVNIPITVDGKTFNKTFTWSKAKKGATGATGATGAGAKTVDIITSSQVFKSMDGGKTFSPTTIKLTPKLQNVTYSNWQYSTNGGSSWTNVVSGEKGMSIDSSNKALTVSKDSSVYTNSITSIVFRLNTNDSSIYDTMTIVKLYDVTDLEIGGTNLLKDSKFEMGNAWQYYDGTSRVLEGRDGSYCGRSDGAIGQTRNISQPVQLDPNTKYTVTAWVKTKDIVKGTTNPFVCIYTSHSLNNSWIAESRIINLIDKGTSDWTKYTATFTTTDKQYDKSIFYLYVRDITGTIWFDDIKLEKGNKATDWSPHPDDSIDYTDGEIGKLDTKFSEIDEHIDGIMEANKTTSEYINLITSDGHITDSERADISRLGDEITYQYNKMIETITAFNSEYLIAFKNTLVSKYTTVKSDIDKIVRKTEVNLYDFRVRLTEFYNAYHDSLYAISNLTKESLKELNSELNIQKGKIEAVLSQSGTIDGEIANIKKYMTFTTEGWLELYGTVNGSPSPFKTRLSDKELSFWDNGQKVAYISNRKLNIEQAEIRNNLKVGNYVMTKSSSNGIVFRKE